MFNDLLLPLALFVFVTAVTPGPNNIMLLSSGLNFGVQRSWPHLLGVSIGFAFMTTLVGLGLGGIFERVPQLYTVLKFAGAGYLLWLAWRIASADPHLNETDPGARPLTFFEAAAFQWVNPKGWVMAIGAISTYAAIATFPLNVAVITMLWLVLGLPASGVWVFFGATLQRVLNQPSKVRAFNIAMGLGLVASLYPILLDLVR
jgi:threonine/homoserine/homoserine lactone efflux protein